MLRIIHVQHPTSVIYCILCGTIPFIVLLLKLNGLHGNVETDPGQSYERKKEDYSIFTQARLK